jgi:cytochrome c553
MSLNVRKHLAAMCVALSISGAISASLSARAIPGLTSTDAFPTGCVDCHVRQAAGTDARISTLLGQWNGKIEPRRLEAMQVAATKGVTLKGKHPPVASGLKDIPASCAKCHIRDSKSVPPLARVMHAIHLLRGEQNTFLTKFSGECTHCHKLSKTTATWSLPSGAEK